MDTRSIVKCRIALVAAMEREVSGLVKTWRRVRRRHEGRNYIFFESVDMVCVCGGIGVEAARRAAEAVIALYHPALLESVGFAGALDSTLQVGDVFVPSAVLDARDGTRIQIEQGSGTLLSFMHIAGARQKSKLAAAYAAQAIEMEAAAVAAAAVKHGVPFGAIKAISDDVSFEIPGTERFVDHEGRFHTARFVFFALVRPWLWLRVMKLAANSHKAATALAKYLSNMLSQHPSELAEPTFVRRHS